MLTIRPATGDDAKAIVSIHLISWKAQFTPFLTAEQVKLKDLDEAHQLNQWQARLRDEEGNSRYTFIAGLEGEFIGYITGCDYDGDYDAELHQIYVLPDVHRRGAGKKLVASLAKKLYETGMRSMMVRVMTINPAVAFYRDRLGGAYAGEHIIPHGDGILREAIYAWSDIEVLFS